MDRQHLDFFVSDSHLQEFKAKSQELADDWNWVKLSSQAEMAMTPTPQQETRRELRMVQIKSLLTKAILQEVG